MDALIGNYRAESQYLAGEREAEIETSRAELAAEDAESFRLHRGTLNLAPAESRAEYEQFIRDYGVL